MVFPQSQWSLTFFDEKDLRIDSERKVGEFCLTNGPFTQLSTSIFRGLQKDMSIQSCFFWRNMKEQIQLFCVGPIHLATSRRNGKVKMQGQHCSISRPHFGLVKYHTHNASRQLDEIGMENLFCIQHNPTRFGVLEASFCDGGGPYLHWPRWSTDHAYLSRGMECVPPT